MADGIKIDGLELQDLTSNGNRFVFRKGGLQSIATFVGSDDDVPGASGQDAGKFTAHHRDIAIHGIVAGSGATPQDARESFATRAASLIEKMDPATLVDVTVYPPNFGLADGEVATLSNCRPMSIDGPDPVVFGYEGWEITLNLRCIDSPPDWVVETESA